MSAFTDRLYRQWTVRNQGGMGAVATMVTRPLPARVTPSRVGSQCATDATSRPEKPVFEATPASPFLPY